MLLFFGSALDKLRDLSIFKGQISNYQILPVSLVGPVSIGIVVLEVTTVILLMSAGYRYGIGIASLLLSVYAVSIWINLRRGRVHIDCGCLGSHGEGISYFHVFRNLILVSLLLMCLLPSTTRGLAIADYTLVILFIISSVLLYATTSLLISNYLNQKAWWS